MRPDGPKHRKGLLLPLFLPVYTSKIKSNMNSKRKFILLMAEGGESEQVLLDVSKLSESPKEKMGDQYEYIYALREITDEVLDIRKGESMYFQPNRDNDLAKGIITRVQ